MHTGAGQNFPQDVQWQTSDPERFPLPDPRFLALHATVAKVAWTSGAAEYVEKILDDRDRNIMPVLATDGSSHAVLSERLKKIVAF